MILRLGVFYFLIYVIFVYIVELTHSVCAWRCSCNFTREQLMIQVMLLILEMEKGTSWELELGNYYVLKFYLELVITFGIIFMY